MDPQLVFPDDDELMKEVEKYFGKLTFRAETNPGAPCSSSLKTFDAYLIDDKGNVVTVERQDYVLRFRVKLLINFFRPHIEVIMELKPKTEYEVRTESRLNNLLKRKTEAAIKAKAEAQAKLYADIAATANADPAYAGAPKISAADVAAAMAQIELEDEAKARTEKQKAEKEVKEDGPLPTEANMADLEHVIPNGDDLTCVIATYTYQSFAPRYHESSVNQNGSGESEADDSPVTDFGFRIVDLSDAGEFNVEQKKELDKFPVDTKHRIQIIEEDGEFPLMLDILHDEKFPEIGVWFNTPGWATRFTPLLQAHKTRLLIFGFESTKRVFQVFSAFVNAHNQPLSRFQASGSRFNFINANLPRLPDLQQSGFQQMINFYDFQEYLTIQYITFAKEQDIINEDIRSFEAEKQVIHLIKSPPVRADAAYIGFFDPPEDGTFRPRPGDVFKFIFDEDDDFTDSEKNYWTFKVIEPNGLVPQQRVCGYVRRPWLPNLQAFSADDPKVTKIDKIASIAEVVARARTDSGNNCRMQLQVRDNVPRNIVHSLDNLVFEGKRDDNGKLEYPFTEFTHRVREVLPAQRIDKLEEHDFFKLAADSLQIEDIAALMSLNEEQKQVIIGMRTAKGGFTITQGPPGTGKTYLIAETCIPFLLMPDQGVHLIFSPSNAGADDLAASVSRRIQSLRKQRETVAKFPHLAHEQGCYVVRLHSKGSEKSIYNLPVVMNKLPRPESRPSTYDESVQAALDELSTAQRLHFDIIRKSEESAIPHVPDDRVVHLESSLGAYMLKAVGLWQDPRKPDAQPAPPWPDLGPKHTDFARLTERQKKEGRLEPELTNQLGRAAYALMVDILQRAKVVVGTTAGVSDKLRMNILAGHTVAITADENARETEYALLPIFATRFTQNPGVHLVGDHKQLAPMMQAKLVTAQQGKLALMTRLKTAGHPVNMLAVQHRMALDIVRPVSKIFYDNQLRSAENLDRRPGAQVLAPTMQKLASNRSTQLLAFAFVEEPRVKSIYHVAIGPTGSKSCIFSAMHGTNLAVGVVAITSKINNVRIAILTQYSDQKYVYARAIERMRMAKVPGCDNVVVDTIDGAQGREFDFVLLDTVIDDSIGMLGDPNRVNVAFTRAKFGLIWIFPMTNLARCNGNATALRSFKRHCQDAGIVYRVTGLNKMPKCKFL